MKNVLQRGGGGDSKLCQNVSFEWSLTDEKITLLLLYNI